MDTSKKLVSYIVDCWCEFSVFLQVLVVASVDGVFVDVLPELQGEEGVLTPGDRLYHMDLVLVRTQVTFKIGARFFFRTDFYFGLGPGYILS